MAEKEPATEQPYLAEDATPTPWVEARRRLADADSYWLATGWPDGLPYLVPVLAVWADGALHFVAVAPGTDHGFFEARKLDPPGEWCPVQHRAVRMRHSTDGPTRAVELDKPKLTTSSNQQ
jgi:hypothetical protein